MRLAGEEREGRAGDGAPGGHVLVCLASKIIYRSDCSSSYALIITAAPQPKEPLLKYR